MMGEVRNAILNGMVQEGLYTEMTFELNEMSEKTILSKGNFKCKAPGVCLARAE